MIEAIKGDEFVLDASSKRKQVPSYTYDSPLLPNPSEPFDKAKGHLRD